MYTVKISRLDYEVIKLVKEVREEKKISQRKLSELMGLSKSFVGKVEALSQPDKYSIRHLSLIAKALDLDSLTYLLPTKIPKEDIIEITYRKISTLKNDGSESKQFDEEIMEIREV